MANGQVLASSTVIESALDTLDGGDASGKFTDVILNYSSAGDESEDRPISISISKVSGAAKSYVDLDNIRLTVEPTRYRT